MGASESNAVKAYYNEHDKYAAAWLRNLISAGEIAPGDVDERSIEDVRPDDLRPYTQCHFFAGLGLWSYALRRAGWSDDRRIWTGSCPCQPFSSAGKGVGFGDERHLWPAFYPLVSQCGPPAICGEQVASKDGYFWLDLVQTDMEGLGYAFWPVVLPIAGVGGPGERHRQWWVALDYPAGARCEGRAVEITESLARDEAWLRVFDEGSGLVGLASGAGVGCRESGTDIGGGASGNSAEGFAAGFGGGSVDIGMDYAAGGGWEGREHRVNVGSSVESINPPHSGSTGTGGLADRHGQQYERAGGATGRAEFADGGAVSGVADLASERRGETRATDPTGGQPIVPSDGDTGASGVDATECAGLEGYAGYGDGTPGREGAAGSITETSLYGGLADAGHSQREAERRGAAPNDGGSCGTRVLQRYEPPSYPGGIVGVGDTVRAASAGHPGSVSREEAEGGSGGVQFGDIVNGPEFTGAGIYELVGGEWASPLNGFWRNADWLFCTDGRWRPVAPGTFPLAYGLPRSLGTASPELQRLYVAAGVGRDCLAGAKAYRVGTLKGYGNAISPEPAIAFIESWIDVAP